MFIHRLPMVKYTATLAHGIEIPKFWTANDIARSFGDTGLLQDDMMDFIISSWHSNPSYKTLFRSRRVVLPLKVARLCDIGRDDSSTEADKGGGSYKYDAATKIDELKIIIGKTDLSKANLVRIWCIDA